MAGVPTRHHNPYADDRRPSSDNYRSHYDGHRHPGRPRDRDGVSRRESRDGPLRRESRDMRDGRESRDMRDGRESRDMRDGRESRDMRDGRDHRDPRDHREEPPRGAPTSPRVVRNSFSQVADSPSDSRPPSRLINHVDPDVFTSKPPTTAKPEYQEVFNILWKWSDTVADKASVKAQVSKLRAEAGPRKAYNTKLEKADEGTSTALLLRTEIRQQERETKILKVKIQENDKSQQRELEQLIPKLIAVATQQVTSAESTLSKPGATASAELERKFEQMQARLAKQEEAFAAREQKLVEHEQRIEAWRKQSQDQQTATIKIIDALRLENENLKTELTNQMREVAKTPSSLGNETCAGHEALRLELNRAITDNLTKCKAVEATCETNSRKASAATAHFSLRLTTMDTSLKKHKQDLDKIAERLKEHNPAAHSREHDRTEKHIQELKDTCANLAEAIKSCETGMFETTEKVDSLDLESLDKMVNTWLDNRIPARVKEHDIEIIALRRAVDEMAARALRDNNPAATIPGPAAADLVTRNLLDSTMKELYRKVQDTVAETCEVLGAELETLQSDVQQLKDANTSERIVALEQARSKDDSTNSAGTSELASRITALEGQKTSEKMTELQSICISRVREVEKTQTQLRSQAHEPTLQVMRQELRPVSDKLEGVAMQANHLDTQWKNISTKDMARTILKELKDVNNMTDSPAQQALESVEKLGRRHETLLADFGQTKKAHRHMLEHMQSQHNDLANFVDVAVRSGQRISDKRPADGAANGGADGHHDPKRLRKSSNTPSQGRPSPTMPQGPVNGASRGSH